MPASKESNLDSFWKLSDPKEKQRIDAALKILSNLSRQNRGNEDGFRDNFDYTLQRFVTGCASDRVSSRKGYFTGLVHLIKMFPDDAPVAKVFDYINKFLNQKGSKSEEADFLCGKMLCYGAILRSEKANPEQVGEVFQKMVEIANKRSYLAVASIQFLVDYLPKLSAEIFAEHVWPRVSEKNPWIGQDAKIEAMWLLLEINKTFPKLPPKSYMLEHFQRKKLLSEDLPREIADVLMNGSTNLRIISQGPVFKGIIDALSQSESLLEDFWLREIVPKVEKNSAFKTSLAFGLLKLIALKWSNKETLGQLLPKSLANVSLQLLAKSESNSEEDLMISSALETLVEEAKGNVKSQNDLIQTLLDVNVSFDRITGSSLVQKLLANAGFSSVKLASDLFKEALASEGSCFNMQQRVVAGQQLAKLVAHPSASEEYNWKAEVISFIFCISQFEIKTIVWPLKALPTPLSKEAKNELKETFFKALDFKVKNLEQACQVLSKVVDVANENLERNVAFQALNSDSCKAWNEMYSAVKKINDAGKNKKEDHVFLMLLIHIGFQLFSNDPQTAIDLLNDLHVCYEKATKKTQKKGSKKDDNELLWIEVVTDLMLSLLSQNRSVLRQVVNTVTNMLCPYMTPKALMTILEVVHPPEEANDEDMEDDDEFEPITEEDLAKLRQEEESEDENEEDDSEEESDEESEAEEIENKEPNEDLKKKLKAAMNEDDSDAESINIDDLDDDAIEKLDTALGQVFKSISGKKSAGEKKKEKKDALALLHFKIRALDMIDSYVNHQQASWTNIMMLVMPLIKALEASSKDPLQAPLETRIKGTLRKLTSIKKADVDDNASQAMTELLKSLIELANSGSAVVTQMNQPIPLFAQLVNLLVKFGANSMPELGETLSQALDDFYNNSQCILPLTFFQLPLQGNCAVVSTLVPKLIEGAFSKDIRLFRRQQAITLLSTVYHNVNLRDKIDDATTRKLYEEINRVLTDFVNGQTNVKHKMLCELLHLIFGLHLSACKVVPWDAMKALLEKVRDKVPKNRNFQDVKRAFNKIGAPLKIKVVQGNEKKRKHSESEDIIAVAADDNEEENKESEDKKKKKKKKKGSKETIQKRKERKRFELEDQYKNIELPSFKEALNDNINAVADGDATTPKKKKKKV